MEQSTRKLPALTADAPGAAQVPGNGSALYVINLCASMTPIAHNDKPLPGFEQYRVYQVSRKEDGRTRYRLRMGFFSDEAEAETALACIREQYPTAFATSLCDEDQRHTRGFASHTRPATVNPVAPAARTAVVAPQAEKAKAAPAAPVATSKPPQTIPPTTPVEPAIKLDTAAAKPSQPQAAKPAATASDTQRVPALKLDKPVQIEVEWEAAAMPIAAPTAASTPAAAGAVKTAPAQSPAPSEAAAGMTQKNPVLATPKPTAAIELTLASDPVAAAVPATTGAPSTEPFHVGKGVHIPTSTLSLEVEAPAPKVDKPTAASASSPTAKGSVQSQKANAGPVGKASAEPRTPAGKERPIAKPAAPGAKIIAPKAPVTPALPKPPVVLGDDVPLPDLDSTQTIRALTAAELDDESQPKWFAVQLAVSDQPINLETMPHLDIFSAYRLYSIATAGSGKILHHMRIGFFKEEVSAQAVCGYLKTFFANPTVLRVSVAEQARFAETPAKPSPSTESKAKVIDLAAARDRAPAREIPVVTMEVAPNPSASGRYPKPNPGASGVHKQPPLPKTAAKSAAASRSSKAKSTSTSGKHKTLQEALLAEAREVELSESAIRRLPKNSSLFSKLFGKK